MKWKKKIKLKYLFYHLDSLLVKAFNSGVNINHRLDIVMKIDQNSMNGLTAKDEMLQQKYHPHFKLLLVWCKWTLAASINSFI